MRGPSPTLGPIGDYQPTGSQQTVTQDVLQRCRDLGFLLAGIAPIGRWRYAEHFLRWLAEGKAGSMHYLHECVEVRIEPAKVFEGTKAFIVVADRYAPRGMIDSPPPGHGRVAKYARGRDYHRVLKQRLHALADGLRVSYPGTDYRTCVDTAPIPERELGHLAGLGWIGKNTMLIHPREGSYFVLGIIATNLDLAPTPTTNRVPDACGTCTRCIDACPTQAITPYSVDASKCISYLTIEHRDQIPQELQRGMRDWVFGCDVCQDVCPHNSARVDRDSSNVREDYHERVAGLDLAAVARWSEEERRQHLGGTPMLRATLEMLRRNAAIATRNQGMDAPADGLKAAGD